MQCRQVTKNDAGPLSRRLLVDVSRIAVEDKGTGIQRVVRSLAVELSKAEEWTIVEMAAGPHGYRIVDRKDCDPSAERTYDPKSGDIFLGLDLAIDDVKRNAAQLLEWKRKGVRLWFVVYDLLPLHHPSWFSRKLAVRFGYWFEAIASLADGFLCISAHVQDELRKELNQRFGAVSGYSSDVLLMGSTFLPYAQRKSGNAISAVTKPYVLCVGTIEPRKAYDLVLDSFELLWDRGLDRGLVLVGEGGWKTAALQRRIRNHVEFGNRLHWLTEVGDQALHTLYEGADGMLAASYDEGFGLPVLEALVCQCRVLARDIPVFRAQASPLLTLFDRYIAPEGLSCEIESWLREERAVRENAPTITRTWHDSSIAMLKTLTDSYS